MYVNPYFQEELDSSIKTASGEVKVSKGGRAGWRRGKEGRACMFAWYDGLEAPPGCP
jgi:hypothetical protein